ncbi:hypothetical protein MRX96_059187 [Rhipicephalus microplus]
MVRCLLITVLLVGHSGVVTPLNFEGLAECGESCGGVAWRKCVDECHCVIKSGDWGQCLPRGVNKTRELPLLFKKPFSPKMNHDMVSQFLRPWMSGSCCCHLK